MAEAAVARVPPPDRALSRRAAVIGVGETDYHLDYQAERARAPGYVPPLPEELAAAGISPGTIRMSVGLEHPDDVVADVLRALDAVEAGETGGTAAAGAPPS